MPRYSLEDIQPAYHVVLPNVTITNGRNKAARALNAQLNIKNKNEQAIKQSIAKVPKEKGLEGVYPEFALLSGGKFTGDIIGDALGGIAGKAISKAAPYVKRTISEAAKPIRYAINRARLNNLFNQEYAKAVAYKNSDEYKQLIKEASNESEQLGFGKFTENILKGNSEVPKVVIAKTPNAYGAYSRHSNTIKIDPETLANTNQLKSTLYHESLHSQRVGEYGNEYLDKYQKSLANYNPKDDIFYELYSKYGDEIEAFKKYVKYKTDKAVKNSADSYIKNPTELKANSMEIGQILGIKPFSPFPGVSKAFDARWEAKKRNKLFDELSDKLSDRDFWNLITGRYIPSVVTPIGMSATYNNSK